LITNSSLINYELILKSSRCKMIKISDYPVVIVHVTEYAMYFKQ